MRPFWLPLLLFAAAQGVGVAAPPAATVEIHYAPGEDLEAIDVDLLNNAGATIDMAAYVLTDAAVIEALGDAADRGVAIRLYLDRGQFETHAPDIAALVAKPGVTARVKPSGLLMHMKAYAIDRARLRTGSGNFSNSGLTRQDNDLLTTDDAPAVARFERDFDRIFAQGETPRSVARY